MKPTPDIRQMLVLSTAHLPENLARAMDAVGLDCAHQRFVDDGGSDRFVKIATDEQDELLSMTSFDCVTFGYLVWVIEDPPEEGLPPALALAMAFAREQGCSWLKYDCDGFEYPNLPAWSWG